ncbi:MAG: outer membrane protein TolC [Halioglobus sp.]
MAQTVFNIGVINDSAPDSEFEFQYEKNLQDEIMLLAEYRFEVKFNTYYGTLENEDQSSNFSNAYASNDIVIALGTNTSNYAINLKDYPKPTISSIILDAQLQGLTKTPEGTSGIKNFTYTESPFNMERDLKLLYEIYPFDHLEVITQKGTIGESPFIKQLFAKYLQGKNVTVDHIFYSEDIGKHFTEMGDEKVAVYALPYFGKDTNRVQSFFQVINENKIPSAALFGERYLDAGALTGYETAENLQKIPRRIALNVIKILEGQSPSDLSVEMKTYGDNLIINMETARRIGIYPDFDILSKAILSNLDNIQTDNKLTLHGAIAKALQNNLNIKVDNIAVDIADTEIGIAKSDLLPQVDASTSLLMTDELTAFTRQGAQGRGNWFLSGSASQVIFAEPILANLAIQKILKASEKKQLLQTQLDVVIDVVSAYMNILFSKNNLNIQEQNVKRNNDNYNISKTKEAIGYTGASDINRWEAELANAKINLNNAFAGLRQSKFQLNQLLNRPINEPFDIADATIAESMLMITDERVGFINDYGTLDLFADFIVSYGKENLPELAQIDLGLKVQERLQLSRERALYLPSVAMSGSVNRVLERFDIPEGLPEVDNVTTWDIGLGVSYPIFQGNNRRKLIEQSKLNVIQLQHTRKNAENQLELLTRASLENVGASFSRMALAQTAADASQKNYEIVQDAYSAGQTNITTLIDAQNNALATKLQSTNAIYTFILDFLNMERSIGYFNFLATPAEKDNFFNKIQQHFNQN